MLGFGLGLVRLIIRVRDRVIRPSTCCIVLRCVGPSQITQGFTLFNVADMTWSVRGWSNKYATLCESKVACEEWCKTVVMEVKHDVSRWWLATNDVKLISPKQVPKLSSYKNLSFQKKRLFFMMIIPLGSQRRGNRKKLIRLGVVKQCLAHMWILEPAYTCEHACQTLTTKLAIVTLSASLKAWCGWML